MENIRRIEINAAIFPSVMSIGLGKPYEQSDTNEDAHKKIEAMIDLPRGAYLLYLQKMADEHNTLELDLLEKFAYGIAFTNEEYRQMIRLMCTQCDAPGDKLNNPSFLLPWGLTTAIAEDGSMHYQLLPEAVPRLRADVWEYILINHLKEISNTIIECYDFPGFFVRESDNTCDTNELRHSLWPWKFSSDKAEQSLSSALRMAFMFTLIHYCFDTSVNSEEFHDYFELEFMKRVALVFDIWVTRGAEKTIKYLPIYDGFYNMQGQTREELIGILKRIIDSPAVDRAEKESLLEDMVSRTAAFHMRGGKDAAAEALENDLIKPAVNSIYLHSKAKENLSAAKLLFEKGLYSDCANRCYYAVMNGLKSVLEKRGELGAWKATALKGSETHSALESRVNTLAAAGVLDASDVTAFSHVRLQRMKCDYELVTANATDIQQCVNHAQAFLMKVDSLL